MLLIAMLLLIVVFHCKANPRRCSHNAIFKERIAAHEAKN